MTTRLIAGVPCRASSVGVGRSADGTEASVLLYQPADPHRHIDAESLLRDAHVEDPPYWALVWIGARAIAYRLLSDIPRPGARVCDLGCGLGLSGVAAGLGGAEVWFCDSAAECLEIAGASAEANGLRNFRVLATDFTRDRLEARFDLILAADIVYDPKHYEPLADFIDAHLEPHGTVLLTESLRADAKVFVEGLKARGFHDDVEAVWVEEEGRRERTWLHTLVRT